MIGWRLLVSLLPEYHGVAFPSQKPVFRNWVRGEEPPPRAEIWQFTRRVFEHCLAWVERDATLWPDLVARIADLPPEWREELLLALEAVPIEVQDQSAVVSIAAEANKVWRHHAEYSNADWALPDGEVERLRRLAESLAAVQNPLERHRWLFGNGMPDLGIPKADAYEEYVSALSELQRDAAAELWHTGGAAAILEAALSYEHSTGLGAGLARAELVGDPGEIVRLLGHHEPGARAVANGFLSVLSGRSTHDLEPLVERFVGTPDIQARILLIADDLAEAWSQLAKLSPDASSVYWREFSIFGRGRDFGEVNEAARRLAEHGRVAAALELLSLYVRGPVAIDGRLLESLLIRLVEEGDEESGRLSSYEIGQLIGYLRETSGLDEESMVRLEWRFLPALRLGRDDSALYRALSTSPQFFVEVISMLYKSDGPDREEARRVDPQVIGNAWRLLREWKRVPGYSDEERRVVLDDLVAWVAEVRALLEQSGRLDVGDLQIGQVLAHAPSNEDGTWPAVEVRDFLEMYSSPHVLRGLHIGVYNKRGVTSRGATEGGEQEYALARQFEAWAEACRAEWPVTAHALRGLAESYMAEGRRFDEDAQRVREGFGF